MATSNVYDNHTIYVKCDCASADQIRTSFHQALTNYQNITKKSIDCRIRVNLVENREGVSYGIAFVFVTNSAVYHMLLGKNADGSDRIEYHDDPSWVSPLDGKITNDSGWSTISPPIYSEGMNWAEMTEMDEDYESKIEEEKSKNNCPKIPFQLEPLMVLPPYTLTEQQIQQKKSKIISDNEGKQDFNPLLVEIPKIAYLTVDRAKVPILDTKFMPNILKCKDIPMWVTKEDIKTQFSPYASDSKSIHERFIKGHRVEEAYPFVTINEQCICFIIFDPQTHDGQFCLHMMRKTIITKKTQQNTLNTVTLIFGHSFRTDRDMMADINQQPRPMYNKDHQYRNSRSKHEQSYETTTTTTSCPPNDKIIIPDDKSKLSFNIRSNRNTQSKYQEKIPTKGITNLPRQQPKNVNIFTSLDTDVN